MLSSKWDVIRCLVTYTDWWQPITTSILQTAPVRRTSQVPEGFRAGLLETLDERTELCRRMSSLDDRDRRLLFLWYVRQWSASEIARDLGISRRQCFRVRAKAVQALITCGEQGQVA